MAGEKVVFALDRRSLVPGTLSGLPLMVPKMVWPTQLITSRWQPRLGNERPGGIMWRPARSVERPSDGGFLRGARLVPPTPPRRESVAWSQRACTPPAACGPSSRPPRWRWRRCGADCGARAGERDRGKGAVDSAHDASAGDAPAGAFCACGPCPSRRGAAALCGLACGPEGVG